MARPALANTLPEQQARPDVLRKTTPIARLEQSLKWPRIEPQDHAAYEKLAQEKLVQRIMDPTMVSMFPIAMVEGVRAYRRA
jgi:hypothetical protein